MPYHTVRVKGPIENDEAVIMKIVDKDGVNQAVVTENGELKVLVSGDFELNGLQVDNVHIVDKDGNEIQLDSDGALTVTTADGKNVALGSTSDADTANTVIGLTKALKNILTAIADSKNLTDIINALSEVQRKTATTFVSGNKTVSDTAAEIFADTARLPDRNGITIINNGLESVYIGESESAVGIRLDPGAGITLHYAGAVYAKTASGTSECNVIEWSGGEL